MSHPGPLLADYVDGALDPSIRAEVDTHLRTCATCREEVALARAGVAAAGTLRAPAAPDGLRDAAMDEAARLAATRNPEVTSLAGRARRRPTTSRVLAAAGAAAAVLLLIVVAPKLGQDSSEDFAAQGSGPAVQGAAAYPAATGVEVVHANYSFDALPDVVNQLRALATSDAGVTAPTASEAAGSVTGPSVPPLPRPDQARTDPARLPGAVACLNEAFHSPSGTLSRVILASYEGRRAYIGVYLVGPGAELPPTTLQLNIASVHGCEVLDQTTARL